MVYSLGRKVIGNKDYSIVLLITETHVAVGLLDSQVSSTSKVQKSSSIRISVQTHALAGMYAKH